MRTLSCLTALLCLTSADALAGEGLPEGHEIDAYVGTDFPLMVGAGVTYESPMRLRGELTGGLMPGGYVDTINWGLTTFDIYSDTVADLIDAILKNALVARAEVGYRPWESRGWTASAGYQHLRVLGNTTSVGDYLEGVDEEAIEKVQEFSGDLLVNAGVHQVMGELGYERMIKDPWKIRATLGFAYTFKANTAVAASRDANDPVEEAALEIVTVEAESYLDFVFEEWVHLPMLGLSAGYRF